MNILIIILAIVLVLILLRSTDFEHFDIEHFDMYGYEEGLPNEYRTIDYPKYAMPMWNFKDYNANIWELRFPYMVKQRYSYKDFPKSCDKDQIPTIHPYANLVDLPLPLDDKYYADADGCQIRYIAYNLAGMPTFVGAKDRIADIYGVDYDDSHEQSTIGLIPNY